MASKRDYTKDIIEEYNIRLQSWGDSDSWGLTEFKMLEDLIYESSKMRINANTLKRFFQQRTSNPQMATFNALCIFLGYSSYAEFVMKKTQQEKEVRHTGRKPENHGELEDSPTSISVEDVNEIPQTKESQDNQPHASKKSRKSRKGIYLLIACLGVALLLVFIFSRDIFKEKREKHLISEVIFQSEMTKGASPFTVKVEYDIPNELMDSILLVCIEANGDITTREINKNEGVLYATFIYPGKGLCQLRYKNKVIKEIDLESRTPGWSVYLKEDRTDFYTSLPFDDVVIENGYMTLPLEKIPKNADTDKLFVSYTYYADSIIDGDNFIFEARVRNSEKEDNGKQCYDIMMYIFSNAGLHGFSLNENCYSYQKFISSEITITGNQEDLSRLNFNPSVWHIMRIKVIDKKTTFYLDNEIIHQMEYKESLGIMNELTLRFKGCGAVDYMKVSDPKTNKVIFLEEFDN